MDLDDEDRGSSHSSHSRHSSTSQRWSHNSRDISNLERKYWESIKARSHPPPTVNLPLKRPHGSAPSPHGNNEDGRPSTSEQGWISPKKTFKKSRIPVHQNTVDTSNSFEVLHQNAASQETLPPSCGTTHPVSEVPPTPSATTRGKTVKPPPIHVSDMSLSNAIALLKTAEGIKKDFILRQHSDSNLTIQTSKLESFYTVKTILSEANAHFFSFTPKNLKHKNVILKGIQGDFSTEDLINEINELNLPNTTIHKLTKITFDKKKPDLFHFLVQLTHDSNPSLLMKVPSLAYQNVKWEPLRKNQMYQCRKCQRLGHTSTNCNLGYRCVKCSDKHGPGECKLQAELSDKNQLYCVNCRENGHPASYRGCPFMKFAREQARIDSEKYETRRNTKFQRIQSFTDSQTQSSNPRNTHKQQTPAIQRNPPHSLNHPPNNANNNFTPSHPPGANVWHNNNNNSSRHLFENQRPNSHETNFFKLLSEMKHELITSMNTQFNNLRETLNFHSSKISHLYEALSLNYEEYS